MRYLIIFGTLCQIGAAHAASGDHSMWSAEWWLVYLTGALAVVTGALFYATYSLAKDARDTSKRQAEENKESFAIARAAADAAKRSVEVAEHALHVGERAYVGVDTVGLYGITTPLLGFKDDRRTIMVSVAYKNFGRTPAINVAHQVDLYWQGGALPDRPEQPSSILLNPDAARGDNIMRAVDQAALQRILQGEITVHVKGTIKYADLFGHRTEMGYHFALGNPLKPAADGEMHMHPEGNYTRAIPDLKSDV